MSTGPHWTVPLLGAVALLLWLSPREAASRRASALRSSARRRRRGWPRRLPPRQPDASPGRRWSLAGTAALAVALLVGGSTGVLLAMGTAVGVERLLRTPGTGDRAARVALARDLPAACDLLGVCLGAGVPVAAALSAVGEATQAPLGGELRAVAALYRLGAEPRLAWAQAPGELAGLGRVLVRAGESGSAVTPALRGLAANGRAAARAATDAGVRRAGVWVLAPLGLCFLPAFVCLGVVPLILGIAGQVFG